MVASSSPAAAPRTRPGRTGKPRPGRSPSQAAAAVPTRAGGRARVPGSSPGAQLSKAAVTPQHGHSRQQPRRGRSAGGSGSGHGPAGCSVTAGSLPALAGGAAAPGALAAARGCSRSALRARKAARSRSSMVTPPRGVGVLWRHCGHGIQRCSLLTASRRFRHAWQKVWPQ